MGEGVGRGRRTGREGKGDGGVTLKHKIANLLKPNSSLSSLVIRI